MLFSGSTTVWYHVKNLKFKDLICTWSLESLLTNWVWLVIYIFIQYMEELNLTGCCCCCCWCEVWWITINSHGLLTGTLQVGRRISTNVVCDDPQKQNKRPKKKKKQEELYKGKLKLGMETVTNKIKKKKVEGTRIQLYSIL